MLNDLRFMAIAANGMRYGRLYGPSLEAACLRAESSQAPSRRRLARIKAYCADVEQRIV